MHLTFTERLVHIWVWCESGMLHQPDLRVVCPVQLLIKIWDLELHWSQFFLPPHFGWTAVNVVAAAAAAAAAAEAFCSDH